MPNVSQHSSFDECAVTWFWGGFKIRSLGKGCRRRIAFRAGLLGICPDNVNAAHAAGRERKSNVGETS